MPETWTLEWCEYIPVSPSLSPTRVELTHEAHSSGWSSEGEYYDSTLEADYYNYYFEDEKYDVDLGSFNFNGIFAFGQNDSMYTPATGYFIPYCLTFDGSNYRLYANGTLKSKRTNSSKLLQTAINNIVDYYGFNGLKFEKSCIEVEEDYIKFAPFSETIRDTSYYLTTSSEYGDAPDGYYRSYYHNECHPTFKLICNPHKNAIIDEVRLSKGVLYTGSTYTPSSQAYTTNTVLVLPENPEKHEIAFKTNTDVADVRFGGARPTYPSNGYVYVSLDSDDKVESIQQYQEDGWYSIEASLYTGSDWVSFSGVSMEYLEVDGIEDDSSDTGGDTGDTGGDSGDSGDSGDTDGETTNGIQAIIDAIGKFFDTILYLVGKVFELVLGLGENLLSMFEGLTVFTDGFTGFLSATFGFLPSEAISLLVSGITLIILLAIIKLIKK